MKYRGFLRCFAAAGTLYGAAALHAEPPPPPGDPAFFAAEYAGLMSLRNADYPSAIKSFTDALHIKGEPHMYMARAVAETLSGQYAQAYDDLDRVRLPNSREPQLWQLAVRCICGKSEAELNGQSNPRGEGFGGIPGNMVQGRDDYDTNYASCVAYELAMPYQNARYNQPLPDEATRAAAAKKAAAWFANRLLGSPDLAAFSTRYSRGLLARGDLPATLDALTLPMAAYPYDADVRFIGAEAYRKLGRPETARREYTVALTMDPANAAAYRGRALAAAAEGDARRANADLASAAKYDPAPAPAAEIKSLLSQNAFSGTPAQLLLKMDATASAGGSLADLVALALELHRADAAGRLRYDEVYQDRLQALEDTIRAKPKDPAPCVAEATYLLQESQNRGDTVEPRRGFTPYRYQYSSEMEINRAISALNHALKINPDYVPALVRLAYAYDAQGNTNKGEDIIKQAIQIAGPSDADAVALIAEYRAEEAGNLFTQARRLRTPTFTSSSHEENRSDGVYLVTVTTEHDPTRQELANADACDEQAQEIVQQAKDLMEKALAMTKGAEAGMLLEASYQSWFGTPQGALAALQRASLAYPNSLAARDALVSFEQTHSMPDEALEDLLREQRLFQTSSGPLLERIWKKMPDTGWDGVKEDLLRARNLDPADARGSAYLAAFYQDQRDDSKSLAMLQEAIALEIGRLTLDEQGAGKAYPRDANDFALLMRLLGNQALRANAKQQTDVAIDFAKQAASFGPRFAPGGNAEQMFGDMAPDAKAPRLPVPTPPNGASLAAGADVLCGELLKAQKKMDDAMPYFLAAAKLAQPRPKGIPKVINGRGETNFSDNATGPAVATAFIEIAGLDMQRGDMQGAMDALNNAGDANPASQQRTQINDMMTAAARQINQPRMNGR